MQTIFAVVFLVLTAVTVALGVIYKPEPFFNNLASELAALFLEIALVLSAVGFILKWSEDRRWKSTRENFDHRLRTIVLSESSIVALTIALESEVFEDELSNELLIDRASDAFSYLDEHLRSQSADIKELMNVYTAALNDERFQILDVILAYLDDIASSINFAHTVTHKREPDLSRAIEITDFCVKFYREEKYLEPLVKGIDNASSKVGLKILSDIKQHHHRTASRFEFLLKTLRGLEVGETAEQAQKADDTSSPNT